MLPRPSAQRRRRRQPFVTPVTTTRSNAMTRHLWLPAAAALSLLSGTHQAAAQPVSSHLRPNPPEISTAVDGSAVMAWNATALQFLPAGTAVSTRILAMTHVAIYDSVIAITHAGEPYA